MKTLIFKTSVVLTLFLSLAAVCFGGPTEDLFAACKAGDIDGVKKAVAAGADVNAKDKSNSTPVDNAFLWPEITRFLLDKGADPNAGTYPAIINASNNYSVEVMKMLLDAGADPNKVGVQMVDPSAGLKAMVEAEQAKGKKANKALIKAWKDAIKNMKSTEFKFTALAATVQQTNCVECLELLIAAGAKADEVGGNPMHRIAAYSQTREQRKSGFAQGVAGMASYGFKVPEWYGNLPDDINRTPGEMMDALAKGDFDINEVSKDGVTPLVVALRTQKLDLSKAMIRNGADPTISVTNQGLTVYPICAAAEIADKELMQLMVEKGADINSQHETMALVMTANFITGGTGWGGTGYTPVIISTMAGHYDAAHYLVEQGADLTIGTTGISIMQTKHVGVTCLVKTTKKTPLYWAIEQDDLSLVQAICEKLNFKFNSQYTVKTAPATNFNHGTYVMKCRKFKSKITPSYYADELGNKEAASYLQSHDM